MSNKILIPVFITFTLFVSQTTQSNKYVLHHSQMQIMPRHTLLNNDSTPKSLEEIQREQGKIKKEKKGGSSMNLNEIIAVNLKRLRAERGFSCLLYTSPSPRDCS